jgi:hypothetical protein
MHPFFFLYIIERNLEICFPVLFIGYYSDDQVKKNEVGGACSTYGGGERCIQDFGGET